jgi:hypothetical protein
MTSRALLIGINAYPTSPLYGCVNDIDNIAGVLLDSVGLKYSETRTCNDERATTSAMRERLDVFAREAPDDAWSLFHYSGHGSTYPRAAEIDGDGECLCPVDFDGSREHMITDVTFCEIMSRKRARSKILVVLDSCFSGGMDRAFGGGRGRAFPGTRRTGRMVSRLSSRLPHGVVVLAGASEDQTGADAVIGGVPNGAFTYCLVESIDLGHDLVALMDMVTATLANEGFDQRPVLLGDSTLFGDTFMGV